MNKQLPPDKTEIEIGSRGILSHNEGALWIINPGDGLRRSRAPELPRDRIEEFSTAALTPVGGCAGTRFRLLKFSGLGITSSNIRPASSHSIRFGEATPLDVLN